MKFNIKWKYLGDPAVWFRDPVPGRDPPFGHWVTTHHLGNADLVVMTPTDHPNNNNNNNKARFEWLLVQISLEPPGYTPFIHSFIYFLLILNLSTLPFFVWTIPP